MVLCEEKIELVRSWKRHKVLKSGDDANIGMVSGRALQVIFPGRVFWAGI